MNKTSKSNQDKVTALLALIRKAWFGDQTAIDRLSAIVGVPSPRIIPQAHDQENKRLAEEYLNLTSHLLDEQIHNDKAIEKRRHRLRPRSAHPKLQSTRSKSSISLISPIIKQPIKEEDFIARNDDVIATSNNLPMANLNDLVPLFKSTKTTLNSNNLTNKQSELELQAKRSENAHQTDLFTSRGIVNSKQMRPVSAAIQRRQDYLRMQSKTRPSTAKVIPFQHITDDEYNDIAIRSTEITPSPRLAADPTISPPIQVNIRSEASPRHIEKSRQMLEREMFNFGDVSHAINHVQDMEQIFRQNTRRLQQKIGINSKGIV